MKQLVNHEGVLSRTLRAVLILALITWEIAVPCVAQTTTAHVGPADDDLLRSAVTQLTDGWREANSKKIAAVLDPGFRFVTLHHEPDTVLATSRMDFLKTVDHLKAGSCDYQLRSVETFTEQGLDFAVVVALYDLRKYGARDHCGVLSIHLFRVAGTWKVVEMADLPTEQICR